MLNRAEIEARVPHAGAMCLLDAVQRWDAMSIDCQAAAPGPEHPLARGNDVPAVAAVEYAAQAAAVHGALLDDAGAPQAGLLVKLADVELPVVTLAEAGGALSVHAELVSRGASACMYRFEVRGPAACVARGRLMIAFAS